MKLSKKDRLALEQVLSDLQRGIGFVLKPTTALMVQHRLGSVDFFECLNYEPYKGQRWTPICKEAGNEFVVAVSAMQRLDRLLNPPAPKIECDHCGHECPKGAETCRECGAILPAE